MKYIAMVRWDMDLLSEALKIKTESVLRFLRDGRNTSFLLKFRLAKLLKWDLVEGHNAPTHLVDSEGKIWIIKTCTKISGVSFCQNSMIGKGRKFNAVDFLNSLKNHEGYLVCDIDAFPTVRVYAIDNRQVKNLFDHGALKDGRLSYKVFENIVNASK